MDARQKKRCEYRKKPMGYYHLSSDGWKDGLLFHTRKEYAMAMTAIALASLQYNVQIYVFELMPNHFHLVLSATGASCIKVFAFIIRRISKQLVQDGYPPLPKGYDFTLTDITDQASFKTHFIYAARNPYEKGLCIPGGYVWGSDYLLFTQWGEYLHGKRADEMSKRELCRMTQSRMEIPGHWEIHPTLGILPKNFIAVEKVRELIPAVKPYLTQCVKDYESFVHIARELKEDVEYSDSEMKDLAKQLIDQHHPGKRLFDLSPEERCKLAVLLNDRFDADADHIAKALYISKKVVLQTLRSKDFGVRKRK